MKMIELIYWLVWLGMITLFLGSIYVAWKAWFGDRSRGRKRCPKCWYDMAYATSMTCSECGNTVQRVIELTRTRRHLMKGLLGIVLSTCLIIAFNETVLYQRNWASYVPTRVLIWFLPVSSNPNSDVINQLISRATFNKLSEVNYERFIQRCVSGDSFALPGSSSWSQKYGSILNRFRPNWAAQREGDTLTELEELLLDLPLHVTLTSRNFWPVGSQAQVNVQALNWWPIGSDCRLRITPKFAGAEPISVYYNRKNTPRTGYSLLTPPLDAETDTLEFVIETFRLTPQDSDDWMPVSTVTISVDLRVTGNVEDYLEPVNDPAMTETLKRVILGISRWESGPSPIRFYVSPRQTANVNFRNVAIGFISEIIRDDQVMMIDHCWWMGGDGVSRRNFGSWSDMDMDVFRKTDFSAGQWSIHVKSDPDLALRAGDALKYWEGEFTIPMPVRLFSGNAPVPHWWIEEDDLEVADLDETGSEV